MNRRALWAALTGAVALVAATGAAAQTADDFPNRPIRIIVPQAAGSGVDLQARTLAQKMGELWGQPGVVENRSGRQRHHRNGRRRQGGARRLHAGLRAGERGDDQRLHLQEAALRPAARLRPDHPDRCQSAGAGRQSRLGDQVDQGSGRARQGEPGPDQLRLVRHRQHDPSAGRAAVARRRHQDDARALPGTDAGDHRHLGRTNSARLHHHGRRDGSRGNGKAQSARHVRRRSATSSFPTRRRRPKPAIRARSWSAGPACSRRPARRRRSSTNCTPAWPRRWRCPTSRTRS